MKNLVLGIDIGGTNIKLGLIDKGGRIIDRTGLITKIYIRDKTRFIANIVDKSKSFLKENNLNISALSGMGIGLPGLIDPEQGIVKFLPNIPGWRNVPLKKILQKKLNVPVFIENDVNLITLGEWKFGAGIGINNLICITLGTGVGGGLVLNGQLYRGEGFAAGEIGHIPINENGPKCNCGGWGCFERYVGNNYLLEEICIMFNNRISTIEEVYDLAVGGNKRALLFWKKAAQHIGNALTGVVNLLNPTHIIVGGGVSKSYKCMSGEIRRIIHARAMRVQGRMVRIVKAKLGNDAGILGARDLVCAGLAR